VGTPVSCYSSARRERGSGWRGEGVGEEAAAVGDGSEGIRVGGVLGGGRGGGRGCLQKCLGGI
jgi:hypothetical protein